MGEMRKAQPSAFRGALRNPEISYGLGWDLTGLPRYDAAGVQVLGKSGGTGNYSSMVYTVPDKRISVAVIAAGRESGAMKIALDILDAVLVERKLIPKKENSVSIPPPVEHLPRDYQSHGGYYAGDNKLGRVVFDAEKKSAVLYAMKGQEKMPVLPLVYNNGYYHDTAGNRYYFADAGVESYLVTCPSIAAIDAIMMQKVKPVEKPRSLRIDMEGKAWLRRNVSPFESAMAAETHFVRSFLYKDLPGYVLFNGLKKIDSPEFAGMPFDSVRDQTELTLFEKDGALWAWVSDLLYSPAESAAVLKAGDNSIRLGAGGHNEWMAARENMVVEFAKPEHGRVIVFSSDDTATYDSALDTGETYVAGGSFIECAGFTGDAFTVKARPAAAGGGK